jgi:hypothetical protein
MRKSMEMSFIVALSVLTVLAAGSVLRDVGTGQASYVDRAVSKGIHAVKAWARTSLWPGSAAASDPGSLKSAASLSAGPSENPVATGTVSTSAGPREPVSWNAQDVSRLTNIVQTLIQATTPEEWKTLGSDIESQNSSSAASEVASVVAKHLSSADQQWLASHFSGPQAFDAGDLDLLQQVVSDYKAELTPDEQSQLQQALSQFLPALFQ